MVYIKNLDIRSFRGISSLQLNNLSQINILTGDNNCGKTSVLEVIQSYENPKDFKVWEKLLRRETSRVGGLNPFSYYEGFYDLFNINRDEKKVEYIVESKQGNVDVQDHVLLIANEGEQEISFDEYSILTGISNIQEEETGNSTFVLPKMDLQIVVNKDQVAETYLVEGQRSRIVSKAEFQMKKEGRNIIYISPSRHTEGNIYLTDILKHPNLYEEMLEILKDYDEDIISINYDNDNKSPGRGIYKILSKAYKEALPLNVYGDGMKKAVFFMGAVLKAQNGILLLDEFETAIHTSAMDRTFRWILETCLNLNVQVFLTSHSKEAIDKVLKCSKKVRDHTSLYTLYKESEKIAVRRLSGEKSVEVQDEMGLELR